VAFVSGALAPAKNNFRFASAPLEQSRFGTNENSEDWIENWSFNDDH
jgi:hypothetical protein